MNLLNIKKLKFLLKAIFLFAICLCNHKIYGQQQTKITAVLNTNFKTFKVNQIITFTNNTSTPLSKIILNDWNNAYSDKYSPLGIRFSDEYVRSFHFAQDIERGSTSINKMQIDGQNAIWSRLFSQIDIIEIELKSNLEPSKSVSIEIEYSLKIPDSKFTRFGFDKEGYNLKNCFLTVARLNNSGEFVTYSNENLEDISNAVYQNINIDFTIPKNYNITTSLDLNTKLKSENEIEKTVNFFAENTTEIQLSIEKKKSYQIFQTDKMTVETNLGSSKLSSTNKAIAIDKIVNYVSDNLGKISSTKLMISQIDYDRNPFYGLNQLPTFLSPFPNEFLFEIKFLKAYLNSYLKASLKIDQRKDGYILDGMQYYFIMKYIQVNYPDVKLIGNISKYKILKSYSLANISFNEQYQYLYLLMARENLDQTVGNPKNTFLKFNEQIAGKYKTGLSFKYLNTYLNDQTVENSFKEFIKINQQKQTSNQDFEFIFKKNTSKNIDWFFSDLINSRKIIDYKFGKISKNKDSISVTIKNNSNTTVPITFSGIKNKKTIFKYWFSNIKIDTTFNIDRKSVDRIAINHENETPEYNSRNNFKSLRSVFSLNRPVKFTFFKDLEDPRYSQIFYVPEFGYNLYDGVLLSLNFHNKSFLEKPFIFDISPTFSTNTSTLSGSGGVAINKYLRNSKLYNVRYGFGGSYFQYAPNANYLKINPSIQLRFRENQFRNNQRQYLTFRHIIVDKDVLPIPIPNDDSPSNYSVFNTRYTFQKAEMIKAIGLTTDLQLSSGFGKVSTEIYYRKLFENNYQFSLRLFAGSFLYKKRTTEFYSFGLDRPKDYLFDYAFYGRSESTGLFSQQLVIAEGGFKSKFENPYANKWMTTLNATSSIWHWIQIYGDIGLYKNKNQNTKFVYDSGVHLNLVPDYFELFFPVYSSNGFEPGQKNYQEKVRFIVTLSPRTLISLFKRKWF